MNSATELICLIPSFPLCTHAPCNALELLPWTPLSYNTDLNATILHNHVLHFLAHFLWRCFHWLTWTWIAFNRFPNPLKLFRPKLYLLCGGETSPYTAFILSWIFLSFFPSFVRNFITEWISKSPMVVVHPHAIALAILSLPALWSHWFVNVAATCQNKSQSASLTLNYWRGVLPTAQPTLRCCQWKKKNSMNLKWTIPLYCLFVYIYIQAKQTLLLPLLRKGSLLTLGCSKLP